MREKYHNFYEMYRTITLLGNINGHNDTLAEP
jgi:hypothetical protein